MQTKTGVIYLQKDKFQVYSPYLPNILEFRFVPELIQDFDLVNKELLENLLKVFIVNNKIPASSLIIVIADNASFIQDFIAPAPQPQQPTTTPPPTLADLQEQANQYLEQVPFEFVAGKTFPLANGVRAYATNQDIYENLRTVLEKLGFIISIVIPGFVFGQEVSNKPVMDGAAVSIILQKISTVQEYNLIKDVSRNIPVETSETAVSEESGKSEAPGAKEQFLDKKNRLKILVIGGSFLLIFGITGAILFSQFANPPYKPPPKPKTTQVAPVAANTPVPTQATAVTPTITIKDLTVQITNALPTTTKADSVKAGLDPLGFKSVAILPQTGGSSENLLLFSPTVSPQIRTTVTDSVKKVLGEITVQEKADATFDIGVVVAQ
jgi:hypothetical protein